MALMRPQVAIKNEPNAMVPKWYLQLEFFILKNCLYSSVKEQLKLKSIRLPYCNKKRVSKREKLHVGFVVGPIPGTETER